MTGTGPSVSDRDIRLLQETAAAAQAGDLPRAFALARAGLDDGLDHPLFRKLRGLEHDQQGRLTAAIADYRAALADAPADFTVLNALGLALARSGQLGEALGALDAAVRLQPAYPPAHHNRGWTLEAQGDLPAARAAYARALEIDPRYAPARSALALLLARGGRWAEAAADARAALAVDPGDPGARLALAMAALGEGRADEAQAAARALADDPGLPPHERSVAFQVLGDALDALDRPADAFAAYDRSNAILRELYAPRFGPGGEETGLQMVERLSASFARTAPGAWTGAPGPSPAAGHAFILGFPRSGTTLLGQVLDAHPDAVALDESEALSQAAQDFLRGDDGLERLAAADPTALAAARDRYWARVEGLAGPVAGKLFIDKLPMNTLGLPAIARLFPAARVVFVRRDPRDVVLSCLRRQFVINPANWEFLDLERAARFYAATMTLADRYLAALDFQVRVLRYEELVSDFPGEITALLSFLGLPPDDAVTAFAGARSDVIATPSAAQIRRGVHGEGAGQWRRYRDQLAPVLPILAPWVERFGYAPD